MFEWFSTFLDWAGFWRFSSFALGSALIVTNIMAERTRQELERLRNR